MFSYQYKNGFLIERFLHPLFSETMATGKTFSFSSIALFFFINLEAFFLFLWRRPQAIQNLNLEAL